MNWKLWLLGAAALVVFDALLIWGVRQWQASRVPSTPLVQGDAVTEVAKPQTVPFAVQPMQTACVAGLAWGYNEAARVWFKLEPARPCRVGDVREVLEREGVVRRYPRASGGPRNLTQ